MIQIVIEEKPDPKNPKAIASKWGVLSTEPQIPVFEFAEVTSAKDGRYLMLKVPFGAYSIEHANPDGIILADESDVPKARNGRRDVFGG